MKTGRAFLFCLGLIAAAAGFSGCASTSLKGTPFYTGEYEKRNGPAEDRVNLWPLLYYRDPALSVLWPVFEHTEDHVAVRPLVSVYRMHAAEKEYNVLWPLAQFDRKNKDNRIFPVYWGDDYAAVFPLYWHDQSPLADDGFDVLFPFYMFFNDRGPDYSLHLLWPLYNRKREGSTDGGRLWPLYGSWRHAGGAYDGWYAWPLGWRWGDATRHSRLLLPLFYQESAPGSSTFASLLGGWHDEAREGWGYLFPLGYHRRDAEADRWYTLLGGSRTEPDGDRSWYAVPALAWGSRSGDRRTLWAGGPLYHSGADGKTATSHLLPLYYRSDSADESLFVSLPYSRHRDASGSWNMVPPAWFHHDDAAGSFSITPLYMWGRDKKTDEPWSAIPPLYYHRDDEAGDTFLSPLFSAWSGAGHTRHTLLPPALTYVRTGDARSDVWTLGGLGHASWGKEAGSSYLFPLYYGNRRRGLTVSPVWSAWDSADGSGRFRMIPPLLSWTESDRDSASLHLLLAWAKFSGGEKPEDSWVFPLYYRDPASDTLLSLFYSKWKNGTSTERASPLLLSWLDRQPAGSSLYLLLGLAKLSGGEKPEDSWVLPLYYRDPSSRTFVSLPYARWTEDDTTGTAIPLLLSSYSHSATDRDLRLLLGAYGRSWSTRPDEPSSSWLFPLYASGKDFFLTPLAGRWKDNTTFTYFPTPLFGWRSGATRGSWLFPLYFYSSNPATRARSLWYLPWGGYESDGVTSESGLFPLYSYENTALSDAEPASRLEGRAWNVLFLAAYENRRYPITQWDRGAKQSRRVGTSLRASNRFFPVWRYERTVNTQTKQLEKEFSLLFFLQDYWRKRELGDAPKTDYTRTRVLWRIVHYERDHDAVSLDVFPAITYDRNAASLRKVSFLWRGFRYERKEGQKAVDVLFIPVWRTAWAD